MMLPLNHADDNFAPEMQISPIINGIDFVITTFSSIFFFNLIAPSLIKTVASHRLQSANGHAILPINHQLLTYHFKLIENSSDLGQKFATIISKLKVGPHILFFFFYHISGEEKNKRILEFIYFHVIFTMRGVRRSVQCTSVGGAWKQGGNEGEPR